MARLNDLLIIALYYDKEHTLNGSQLRIGTQNVTRAGPALFVNSVTRLGYPEGVAVYNLSVDDDHSYFVGSGSGGAWVHNGGSCLTQKQTDAINAIENTLKNHVKEGVDGDIAAAMRR